LTRIDPSADMDRVHPSRWLNESRLTALLSSKLPLRLRRPAGALKSEFSDWRVLRGVGELVERVKPYTMVTEATLLSLAHQVARVLEEEIPGDLVECGVWRGGSAFLMAELLRRAGVKDRKVWLFDSFEGLPPPKSVDGPAALEYAAQKDSPLYRDNCRASIEEVHEAAAALGLTDHVQLVKGWFDATLPARRSEIGPIALLRIDADWYESVYCCLNELYDQVSVNGFVTLDDYYTWDGCSLATHAFLAERKLPERLQSDVCAYFRKRGA
jgi:hypothetical protein